MEARYDQAELQMGRPIEFWTEVLQKFKQNKKIELKQRKYSQPDRRKWSRRHPRLATIQKGQIEFLPRSVKQWFDDFRFRVRIDRYWPSVAT